MKKEILEKNKIQSQVVYFKAIKKKVPGQIVLLIFFLRKRNLRSFSSFSVASSSVTFQQNQQIDPNLRQSKVSQLILALPLSLKLTVKKLQDFSTNHQPCLIFKSVYMS